MVKVYKSCQRYQFWQSQPADLMKIVVVACPFDQWEVDIVGSFLLATTQKKFLIIVIDYFFKWMEIELIARIIE